jgi:hypothetical protein
MQGYASAKIPHPRAAEARKCFVGMKKKENPA